MNATAQRLYQAAHKYQDASKNVYSATHVHGRHKQTVKQTAMTILLQSKKHSGNAETFHDYSQVYLALSKWQKQPHFANMHNNAVKVVLK